MDSKTKKYPVGIFLKKYKQVAGKLRRHPPRGPPVAVLHKQVSQTARDVRCSQRHAPDLQQNSAAKGRCGYCVWWADESGAALELIGGGRGGTDCSASYRLVGRVTPENRSPTNTSAGEVARPIVFTYTIVPTIPMSAIALFESSQHRW